MWGHSSSQRHVDLLQNLASLGPCGAIRLPRSTSICSNTCWQAWGHVGPCVFARRLAAKFVGKLGAVWGHTSSQKHIDLQQNLLASLGPCGAMHLPRNPKICCKICWQAWRHMGPYVSSQKHIDLLQNLLASLGPCGAMRLPRSTLICCKICWQAWGCVGPYVFPEAH